MDPSKNLYTQPCYHKISSITITYPPTFATLSTADHTMIIDTKVTLNSPHLRKVITLFWPTLILIFIVHRIAFESKELVIFLTEITKQIAKSF